MVSPNITVTETVRSINWKNNQKFSKNRTNCISIKTEDNDNTKGIIYDWLMIPATQWLIFIKYLL